MLYSLVVAHGTLYISDVTDVLNNTDALIIHARAAIQVVYHHYMLTPCVECLWNVGMLNVHTFV